MNITHATQHPFFATIAHARDLGPEVITNGRLRIMPASYYRGTTREERMALGVRYGVYGLPTLELIDWLRTAIAGRSAIEVGAGSGILAEALGIPATDNRQQERPDIIEHTRLRGREPITYGQNVEGLDARAAVAKYRPEVVVACWVTHQYRGERHYAGGNQFGVDEEAIIDNCDEYIFIGNEAVHANKSIWALPHTKIEPDWLYSASMNGSPDFIARWARD